MEEYLPLPSVSLKGAAPGLALALIVTGVNFSETFAIVGTQFVGIGEIVAIPTKLPTSLPGYLRRSRKNRSIKNPQLRGFIKCLSCIPTVTVNALVEMVPEAGIEPAWWF
jgi:hypothetical protein